MEEERPFSRILTLAGTIGGAVLTIVVGVYLVLTASPAPRGQTTLRWQVDPSPIRKVQIAGFEKQHPNIKVINDVSAGTTQQMIPQIIGGAPGDVIAIYEPQIIEMMARNDLLLDMRPYVKKYNIPVDQLRPGLEPYVYYGDQIVGMPENCGTFVVFYNRRLFRKAGIPYPKNGWTWDDCLAAARKLTKYKSSGGRQVPVRKGIWAIDPWVFIWMYGGRMFSEDGTKCLMNSPEVKKGMRFWANLRLKYHVMPSVSEAASMAPTGDWGLEALLFREEKVAMLMTGRWMIIQMRMAKNLDYAPAPMPVGSVPVSRMASKCYSIPRNSRNRDAALQYISYLLTKENQLRMANYGDGIPTVQSDEITKAFLYNPEYPTETYNQLYLDDARHARNPEFSRYLSNLDLYGILNSELDRMWLGQQTSDQTCEKIARRMNSRIARNLANPNFLL